MDHTRFEELKEAYVLNALSEGELQDFEAYLAAYPERQAEIDELASVATLLAFACEEREPSPELRHSLFAQIESEAQPLPPTTRVNWWTRFWESLNWRRVSAGLAALVLAGLLGWNIVLQSELQNRQIFNLEASGSAADASGEIIYLKNSNEAMLVAENLPSLAEEQTYQIWVIKGEKPIPSGLFKPQQNGEAAAPITSSISEADEVAVTNEPAPRGSSTPTGSKLLQTRL